jgi:tRNA(fMet)-specific endonuclease VapC
MNYVLDTNIITAILKDNAIVKGRMSKAVLDGDEIFLNGISYYEIKRGLLAANATKQLNLFVQFCSKFPVLLLDSIPIFDQAAEIYAHLKKTGALIGGDADILIASMVKFKDFILVTNNTAHFHRIQDLKTDNWLS